MVGVVCEGYGVRRGFYVDGEGRLCGISGGVIGFKERCNLGRDQFGC